MTAFTADRKNMDLNHDPGAVGYTSNALKLFMEHIEHRPERKLLDVGPVCQENIRFFASRVKKLYVCDMFIRLGRCIRKGSPVDQIWEKLDYPPQSFDGILLWELADRLDDPDVKRLVTLCHTLLRPGGMAMVVVLGDQSGSSAANAFVVGQNFRVNLRLQPHLHLPLRSRQNRDVLSMMVPFIPAKSFICRPGFMEFLFKRE
ncbi:MAG TPA: class I SAM-dependent methyltransferase [Desulfobacterales bacterium]|nr:class I SAM-dependent methyltransferase [Desulfobacterales bacterium]